MKAISLFSCGGIGDLAMHGAGIEVLVANELETDRAEVFCYNFPKVEMIVGDIWTEKETIVSKTRKLLASENLDIVFATPPCQGMSKNGRGKLLNLVRKGERPQLDPRNLLVIPAIDVFLELNADTLIMENVPEMESTLIPSSFDAEKLVSIPEYIIERLGPEYSASIKIIEFADFGVPQRRQRLISIFTKNCILKNCIDLYGTIFPQPTHSKKPTGNLKPWVTVRDVISNLPPLNAGKKDLASHESIPDHKVPLLDSDKYFWVSNTPACKSAFDNQCVNPLCNYENNITHGTKHNRDGINRANTTTPINCEKCGELLPRPWVKDGEKHRIMKGFTSAYKRMSYDLPSSALTRNLSYACSDNKLHPEQNRVLSIYEACMLHTIADYSYVWKRTDGKKVSDKLKRELIGESIPPLGLQKLLEFLLDVQMGTIADLKDIA